MSRPRMQVNVQVPMRDGVNLAANVYLPDGTGPFPVVLNRTPYGKDNAIRYQRAQLFVQAGYAVVHMDVRGRGDSQGIFEPNFQEIEDGHDSLNWCGMQPWSTGVVGTYGGSYEGWTQIFPTRLHSPFHRAAFLMCTPSMHPFKEGPYWSGVPSAIMGLMALYISGKTVKEFISELNWEDWANSRPLKDLVSNFGLPDSYWTERAHHPTFDSYYRRLWYDGVTDLTRIPCYHVSGWYDDSLGGTLDLFPALSHHHPDPQVRRSQKLLIGPWPHRLSSNSSKLGDFDYGEHSMVSLPLEAIRWFDYWLKGIDNGIMDEPRCRVFLMGANRWVDANSFPFSNARQHSFLLGAESQANSLNGGGILDEKSCGSLAFSTFQYDPQNPVPAPFWKENFQSGTNEDLRTIQVRPDVLVFTSSPLESPLNIIGRIKAELYVSTSARDTDFVARLSDVHPEGYAQRLNHGILRLRFRNGYEKVELVKPGEVVRIEVDLWGTGHQVQPGHCLRLEVTSSGYPVWAPNYNTGEDIWEETTPVVATNTVHHSVQYPSRLILEEVEKPTFIEP